MEICIIAVFLVNRATCGLYSRKTNYIIHTPSSTQKHVPSNSPETQIAFNGAPDTYPGDHHGITRVAAYDSISSQCEAPDYDLKKT